MKKFSKLLLNGQTGEDMFLIIQNCAKERKRKVTFKITIIRMIKTVHNFKSINFI